MYYINGLYQNHRAITVKISKKMSIQQKKVVINLLKNSINFAPADRKWSFHVQKVFVADIFIKLCKFGHSFIKGISL